MRRNTIRVAGVILSITAVASGTALLLAQTSSPSKGTQSMEAAIAAVPGYLGVKRARTDDGTDVSLIWFKNKAALLRWYESDVHQEVMNKYFADVEFREPLADIADDSGPLLVMASFTRANEAQKRLPLFSQFAIEIYRPLEGGLFVGDTMAPNHARPHGLREFEGE